MIACHSIWKCRNTIRWLIMWPSTDRITCCRFAFESSLLLDFTFHKTLSMDPRWYIICTIGFRHMAMTKEKWWKSRPGPVFHFYINHVPISSRYWKEEKHGRSVVKIMFLIRFKLFVKHLTKREKWHFVPGPFSHTRIISEMKLDILC